MIGAQYDIPTKINRNEGKNHVKVIVRPVVPNNAESWQVFDFGQHIVNFLREEAEFAQPNQQKLQDQYEDQVIRLRINKLPKGLVTLESISNTNDQLKKDKSSI